VLFRQNCQMNAEQDKSNWPDPGLAALVMLLRFHGLSADPERIRHRFGRGTIGIPGMLCCAKELGLKARSESGKPATRAPIHRTRSHAWRTPRPSRRSQQLSLCVREWIFRRPHISDLHDPVGCPAEVRLREIEV